MCTLSYIIVHVHSVLRAKLVKKEIRWTCGQARFLGLMKWPWSFNSFTVVRYSYKEMSEPILPLMVPLVVEIVCFLDWVFFLSSDIDANKHATYSSSLRWRGIWLERFYYSYRTVAVNLKQHLTALASHIALPKGTKIKLLQQMTNWGLATNSIVLKLNQQATTM